MLDQKYVAYYRVSTRKQGESGLGLAAQKAAIEHFVSDRGTVVEAFEEIESGALNSRPELSKALKACKQHKATLIVAKLDRLGRNVAFISSLMEASVEFLALDNPSANRLTLHILAAMAEHEREMISQRTKAGLQQARMRGVKLGSPTLHLISKKGAQSQKRGADHFAANVVPIIEQIRNSGITSLQEIAAALNARGVKTARGGEWHKMTVSRLLQRQPVS